MFDNEKFQPHLGTVRSKKLLEGVYKINQDISPVDEDINANDFIKQKGNYKQEHFRLSEIYDH